MAPPVPTPMPWYLKDCRWRMAAVGVFLEDKHFMSSKSGIDPWTHIKHLTMMLPTHMVLETKRIINFYQRRLNKAVLAIYLILFYQLWYYKQDRDNGNA